MDHDPGFARSAFAAGDDRREYNVYIETANVENAWPSISEWPPANQIGPLLVSLKITPKMLEDTLDETGTRTYMNDAAKPDVVVGSICLQLMLVEEIAFERGTCDGAGDRDSDGSLTNTPDTLFGAPSRESAWKDVMAKLSKVGSGGRLQAEIQSRYGLAVNALGFDLGLSGTPGRRGIDRFPDIDSGRGCGSTPIAGSVGIPGFVNSLDESKVRQPLGKSHSRTGGQTWHGG